ncbi:MAG: pyroglutamyl-peptidase I [Pirellulaceae bacterium]|nr:pyroglutamyl-peptidase I [Pirellulaceae bacterium]
MRVLLTAFEPYGQWPTNSSWLTLVELLRIRPPTSWLVTRRYPVDFDRLHSALYKDLSQGFDAVLHLGQAPGSATVRLETLAVNAGGSMSESGEGVERLIVDGPEAYRSHMPLNRWSQRLREQAIPTQISYHAGTYLCNAIMYLSHHWVAQSDRIIPVGFVHLPLATEQVVTSSQPLPSLPVATLAQAVAIILDDLLEQAV